MQERKQVVTFPFPKLKVFNAVLRAIQENSWMKVLSADEDTGRIEAKRKISFLSLGEHIQVQVRETPDKETEVILHSDSAHVGTDDWGRNEKNINVIFDGIRKYLYQR